MKIINFLPKSVILISLPLLSNCNILSLQLNPIDSFKNAQRTDFTSHIGSQIVFNYQYDTHPKFGSISFVEQGKSIKSEPVFDSWWNNSQPTDFITLDNSFYRTYKMQKYIDIPIKIYHTRNLYPYTSASFTIEQKNSTTQSFATTVEKGNSAYAEYSSVQNYKFGAGIMASLIGISGSYHDSSSTVVGYNTYSVLQQRKTTSTTFQTVYSETFTFDNNQNDFHLKFQLNNRQKYEIYFVAEYEYNYKIENWGSGLFSKDQNWSYTQNGFIGKSMRYFLLPIGQPYFEVTQYISDNHGQDIVFNKSNTSIYFI